MPIKINTREFVDEVRKLSHDEDWCHTPEQYLQKLGLEFKPYTWGGNVEKERMILTDDAPEFLDADKVADVVAEARAEYPSEARDGLAKLRERFGIPDRYSNDKVTVTVVLSLDDFAEVGWDPKQGDDRLREYVIDAIYDSQRDKWLIIRESVVPGA